MALVPVTVYQIFDFTDCNAEHQKRYNGWVITEVKHCGAKLSLRNIVDGATIQSISAWKIIPY